MNAADRFRAAAARGDLDGITDTLAPDVRLYRPTGWPPIEGRDRVRAVFAVLVDIFEDFEYTHMMSGPPLAPGGPIAETHALVFRCRVGGGKLEGVDVLDIDHNDRIAVFTVFGRPLEALRGLADAVKAEFVRRAAAADDKP